MKKKILSTLLAFATLFAIALPTNVYADFGDDVTYENLYLITDNHYFFDYESAIATNLASNAGLNITDKIIHIQPLDDSFSRLETIANNVAHNSIVIVDIQERIPVVHNNAYSIEVNKLYNAFGILKSKDCKIMFISGNDEDTLQNLYSSTPDYLEFLDYVDVHVNDDFYFVLVKAVITRLEELLSDTPNAKYSIILDAALRNDQSDKDDFAKRWIMPYLEEVYQDEYSDYNQNANNENYSDIYTYLSEKNGLSIYGQSSIESNMFYNYLNNTTSPLNTTSLDQSLFELDKVFMCGTATPSQIGSPWQELNSAINNAMPEKFFSMVFQTAVMNLADLDITPLHNIGISELMFFGLVDSSDGIYTLNEMIADFINNDDMQKYNNMVGRRCAITYMPMLASSNGWIPSHLILNCLQICPF